MSEFCIRDGVESDHALVFNSTARALRFEPLYADLSSQQYTDTINAIVGRMLRDWTLLVATFVSVPDEIAGFVLFRAGVLGSIFVKKAYRRRAVGRMLMDAAELRDFACVFHRPRAWRLAQAKGYGPRLSPYLAFPCNVV